MTKVTSGTLRYDILSDTNSLFRCMRSTRAQLKQADALFRKHRTPLKEVQHEMQRLTELRKKDMISARIYRLEMTKLQGKERELAAERRKRITMIAKERRDRRLLGNAIGGTVTKLRLEASAYKTALKNIVAYARGKKAAASAGGGNHAANIGGSLGSALGFGGAGAGAGRLAGLGGGAAALGLGAAAIGKSIKEFAQLETAIVDLQVIMGSDEAGKKLVDNLRAIARETPLTSKQLIKNAQTMIGYGQSAEGIEDTLYRLGEISGGNTEKFNSLTIAFSQVNSAGKLMGQELLQLVNAGYPIASIADAAGVSMADFRSEMEKGNISARHLTESMINLTSEGGLMEGRLSRQAETVAGAWTRLTGEIEQDLASFGEKNKAIAYNSMGALKGLSDMYMEVGKQANDFLSWSLGDGKQGMAEKGWYDRALGGFTELFKRALDAEQDFGIKSQLSLAFAYANGDYGGSAGRAEYEKNQSRSAMWSANWAANKKPREMREAQDKARLKAIELEAERYKSGEQAKLDAYKDRLNEEKSLAFRQNQEWRKLQKESAEWSVAQYNAARDVMFARHKKERAAERAELDKAKAEADADRLQEDRKQLRAMFEVFDKVEAEEKELNQKLADARIKKIDDDAKRELKDFSDSNKPAASFEAGSVEEYNMRRDIALQRRKEARQEQIAAIAEKDRKAVLAELKKMNDRAGRAGDANRNAVSDTLKVLN